MNAGVAIIGAVQTRYEAAKDRVTYNELVYGVVRELLDQTGIPMAEIDSMVTASQDFYDGKTISSMSIAEVVGGYLKSEAKVAGDGLQALLYGAARVVSGSFPYTLVVAHCKESESTAHQVTLTMFDPYYQRPLGLDEQTASALEARRYLAASGATEEDLARVSRKNHLHAMRNPFAQRSGDFSTEQILGSPVLADPLRDLMVGPVSDGACAVLLADPERARRFNGSAVWIAGFGNSTDAYWTERDLAKAKALEQAAARAYLLGGIGNPREEINFAEISARSAHQELLYLEALGIAPPRQAHRQLADGCFDEGGEFPVNLSGGSLTGNPTTVAGLARVVEAWRQFTGVTGAPRIKGARLALAHGVSGICGQNHSVAILSREPRALL
jgi:acetyl-CoA C-acetyltransferase